MDKLITAFEFGSMLYSLVTQEKATEKPKQIECKERPILIKEPVDETEEPPERPKQHSNKVCDKCGEEVELLPKMAGYYFCERCSIIVHPK